MKLFNLIVFFLFVNVGVLSAQKLVTSKDLMGTWQVCTSRGCVPGSERGIYIRFSEGDTIEQLSLSDCGGEMQELKKGVFEIKDTVLIFVSGAKRYGEIVKQITTIKRPKVQKNKIEFSPINIINYYDDGRIDTIQRTKTATLQKIDQKNGPVMFCYDKNVEWMYNFEDAYPSIEILHDNGFVYFGSGKTPVIKLDASTGKEVWRSNVVLEYKGVIHPIIADQDHLYFIGTQGGVFKISKESGKQVWKYDAKFDDDIPSYPSFYNNNLIVNTSNGKMIALDKNGKLLWETKLERIIMSYSVYKDKIYGHQEKGGLVVINANTGKIEQTKKVFDDSRGYYKLDMVGKNLIMSNGRDSIKAVDVKSLDIKWTFTSPYVRNCSVDEKTIIAHSRDSIFSLSPKTGLPVWKMEQRCSKFFRVTGVKKNLYMVMSKRSILVLDRKTGRKVAVSPFKNKTYTQPLVLGDYIVIGLGGKILKIKNPVE